MTDRDLAELFAVLGEPSRLKILRMLIAERELPVTVIAERIELSQPTATRHLKMMYQARLLDWERRGRFVFYRLHSEVDGSLADVDDLMYEVRRAAR